MSKLIRMILEEIEYEKLIEEGKDPSEILHYKYRNVPSNVIDKVIEIDPTKKKSYSQWLLSRWDDEKYMIMGALKSGQIKKMFDHFKNHQEIQIKDCPSLAYGLRMYASIEDNVLKKSDKPLTYVENLKREVDSEDANDFDVVFNKDKWIIAVPNTYEAECKLGENMKWCTANAFGDGESYYENYLSRGGKYYVNFDLSHGESAKGVDYPYTRYQFHFETNQFMDKDDEPVVLSDIGMPDSAKEFYLSEGYDEDNFMDYEAKMEAYEERRNECAYRLNNEVALMIAYDENYNFSEPDEDTEFFVFDENDDRDPIAYDAVPNPHTNDDVIIVNKKNYIILNTVNNDDEKLIVINDSIGGWREWSSYLIHNYLEMPGGAGVFALIEGAGHGFLHGTFLSVEGVIRCNGGPSIDRCKDMFFNHDCMMFDASNDGRTFIEVVADGYHSLFAATYPQNGKIKLECIIKKDEPIDGNHFTVNSEGIIEGRIGKYRIGINNSEVDDTAYQYDDTMGNFYIVTRYSQNHKSEQKNVVRRWGDKPIFSEWVKDVKDYSCGVFIVTVPWDENDRCKFIDENGKQIGDDYVRYGMLNKDAGMLVALKSMRLNVADDCHLIDCKRREVVGRFSRFIDANTQNGIMIVTDNSFENSWMYDFMNGKYVHQEFGPISRFDDGRIKSGYYFCKPKGGDGYSILDFKNERIVANGIEDSWSISFGRNMYNIVKTNGKHNLFGKRKNNIECEFEMILPNDVDAVVAYDDSSNEVIYADGGKFFVYDITSNEVLINQNGTDIKPEFLYGHGISYTYGEYETLFYDNGTFKKWRWSGYSGSDINQAPTEIKRLYGIITGGYTSVSEGFKHYLKRLDSVVI